MLAGHIGVAMALSSTERRLNLGVFVFAALFLDVLLWAMVLLGWEAVEVPADFASRRQLAFDFPYSHGLLASLGWSALAAVLVILVMKNSKLKGARAGILVGAALFSHWLLDVLVHVPEMPLSGNLSTKVGLSLWNHLTTALVAESLIALAGLCFYLPGCGLSRRRKVAAAALSVFVLVMTVAGMTAAPAPPGPDQIAISSLIAIVVIVALFSWIDAGRARPSAVLSSRRTRL